jgi:hypothetical protein
MHETALERGQKADNFDFRSSDALLIAHLTVRSNSKPHKHFSTAVRELPSLPNKETDVKQARFVEIETERCPWWEQVRCQKCSPDR